VEAIQAEGKARVGAKDGEMGAAAEKVEAVEVMVVVPLSYSILHKKKLLKREKKPLKTIFNHLFNTICPEELWNHQ
jgi:hypothetical protein